MSTSTTLDRPDTAVTPEIDTDLEAAFREIVDLGEKVKDDDGAGDHERLSHYVDKEDIVLAATTGAKVFAMCGKKWTPNRSPEKYPVCPDCELAYRNLAKD